VQSVAGGNSMMFNHAARQLLAEAAVGANPIAHDWWAYQVISGCSGLVHYDPWPSVRYRQHGGNLVGINATWSARLARVRMMCQGRFRNWNDKNIEALNRLRFSLTPENQEVLDRFSEARNLGLIPRIIGLKRSGIYRQTLLGNLGLVAAAIFKKI
jgi:hypothetical protein